LIFKALFLLFQGWNLISGQQMTTQEFVDQHSECNVSIMWYWDAPNQQWDAWTADYFASGLVWIPEVRQRYFDEMYAHDTYWVFCK